MIPLFLIFLSSCGTRKSISPEASTGLDKRQNKLDIIRILFDKEIYYELHPNRGS